MSALPGALLDVDGTLVDSNYQHALCWFRALRQSGRVVPIQRIHRHIGMGGDQLVRAVAGEDFDARHGDQVRAAESVLFRDSIEQVAPLPGAREFVELLVERGHRVVLSSSAKATEVEHFLDLLGVRDLVADWTTSADVENTKPEPDLIRSGLDKLGLDSAVLVGDTTWDIKAATAAGVPTIGILSGGFGADELREAGATAIYVGVRELAADVGNTALSG